MMEKIFTSVAIFAVALMVATAGLGLWLGDLHGQTDQAILRWGNSSSALWCLSSVGSRSRKQYVGDVLYWHRSVVPRGCGDIPSVG